MHKEFTAVFEAVGDDERVLGASHVNRGFLEVHAGRLKRLPPIQFQRFAKRYPQSVDQFRLR